MNNENRNEEAVSPVIATILMVAITVVLAGVLYVWASSLADDSTGGGLDKYQFSHRDAADTMSDAAGDAASAHQDDTRRRPKLVRPKGINRS